MTAPGTASRPIDRLLGGRPSSVALVGRGAPVTYGELADRVAARADELGPTRRLVAIGMTREIDPIVTYLAALRGGHPVLLLDAGDERTVDRLLAVYDPDVVALGGADPTPVERRRGTRHQLHPELGVLLSTSGSTGSPKLVRLSQDSVASNAAAIGASLGLVESDRAVTTLPLHYCYGLSVLNSHLLAGAAVVLDDRSVVDPCFWDRFREVGATSFAGVPHTFDLLDRVGFASMALPSLRQVTQAGGRLAPDAVRRYAELGRRDGWDLYVMYGQTEATARMAYLPPELAASHPTLVGRPVPGGSFAVEPVEGLDDPGLGELVYRGPNVMLGYAEAPADLADGRTCEELRTGDLGRLVEGGLVEITGRLSRFVKPLGLRIDLDQVQRDLGGAGIAALCAGDDLGVVVATEGPAAPGADVVARAASKATGLPPAAVDVVHHHALPRLGNGKPDLVAVLRSARSVRTEPDRAEDAALPRDTAAAVRAVFAQVLDRPEVRGDSTFVGLGGDSLSYVEASIRLEAVLGHLPPDWHVTTVDDLVPRRRGRYLRSMEANVVLRAVAIVLVVASHTRWFVLHGGAHALLGVAGYNFARFQLTSGRMARSIARIAVPSVLWIGAVAAVSTDFSWPQALLVNDLLGGPDGRWAFWFIEVLVQTLAVLALAFSVPSVRRLERRAPFAFPIALALAGLVLRFDVLGLPSADHEVLRPQYVFWLFALGWAAARARTSWHRLVLSAVVVAGVPGLFEDAPREAVVAAGLLLLIWVERIAVPRALHRVVGAVAAASLHIYLVHWEVFPLVNEWSKPGAFAVSMAAGWVAWLVAGRVGTAVASWWAARRAARTSPADREGALAA
ncbi:MAG TPA: AMP-binding protein [Aquihabitans sp.]|nr:AMP-binding protein [Aquihabitans sp.]